MESCGQWRTFTLLSLFHISRARVFQSVTEISFDPADVSRSCPRLEALYLSRRESEACDVADAAKRTDRLHNVFRRHHRLSDGPFVHAVDLRVYELHRAGDGTVHEADRVEADLRLSRLEDHDRAEALVDRR